MWCATNNHAAASKNGHPITPLGYFLTKESCFREACEKSCWSCTYYSLEPPVPAAWRGRGFGIKAAYWDDSQGELGVYSAQARGAKRGIAWTKSLLKRSLSFSSSCEPGRVSMLTCPNSPCHFNTQLPQVWPHAFGVHRRCRCAGRSVGAEVPQATAPLSPRTQPSSQGVPRRGVKGARQSFWRLSGRHCVECM